MAANLEGRVAIVTGASRGLGRAMSLALARAGADVVAAARTTEPGGLLPGTIGETARQVEALGRRALPVQCDVTKDDQVEAMVASALAELGRVDLLINNAGVGFVVPIAEMTMKRWDLVLAVNLRGAVLCSKAVLPAMTAKGSGAIVNVSSMLARRSVPGWAAYSASKGAMEAFTRCCARDLGQYGITVNAVAPGAIRTDIWGDTLTPGAEKAQAERVALGHIGEPEDVAGIVVFLSSSAARFITGEVILVDGGRGTCDYLPTEHALGDKMYP
jgi:NAD(P)-dependent dehydrogenase (short-subunit alcohol dehydrogenase family)